MGEGWGGSGCCRSQARLVVLGSKLTGQELGHDLQDFQVKSTILHTHTLRNIEVVR